MRLVLAAASFVLAASVAHADGDPADPAPAATTEAPPPTTESPPPAVTPPTTTVTPATADEAPPAVPLRDDPAAEQAYEACNALLADEHVDVGACYMRVARAHPGTLAAVKAEAGLVVLTARLAPPVAEGQLIPPGRLGITTAMGLFGVWNAVAGGVLLGLNVPETVGTGLVAGTGAAAVVAGVGYGVGGYLLADALKLDEGAARLVASSLVWGTVMGAGLVPTLGSAGSANNPLLGFNLAIVGVVGAGYVGAGAALLLTSMVTFDEAQVGMINSGGVMGAALGLVLVANVGGSSTPLVTSLAFSGSTALGLGVMGLAGRRLALTWGEALLCDLGLVLGGVVGGTASIVVASTGNQNSLILSALPVVGMVGGYAAGAGFVGQWRAGRGAPIWRDAPDVRPVVTTIVTPREAIPAVGVAGHF